MRIIIKPMGLLIIVLVVVATMIIQWTVLSRRSMSQTVVLATPSSSPMPERKNLLTNGSMTDVDHDLPAGWNNIWTGNGKIKVTRDGGTFHTGPAALRLESIGGSVKGQAASIIGSRGGQRIAVKGWMKSDVQGVTQIAIQPYDQDWHPKQMIPVGLTTTPTGWSLYRQTVTLPEGTANCGVLLYIEGTGKAWLDDVTVTEEEEKTNPPGRICPTDW